MAYKRSEYKNKIESPLTGAIVEFYKATLARKNAQTRWVDHWMSEVEQHLQTKLVAEILHPIRGFTDRRKAFDEAVVEIKHGDGSYRRYAEHTVKRDYKLAKLRAKLDEADTAAFWKLVEDAAEPALLSFASS
jgi:hypothetical protein